MKKRKQQKKMQSSSVVSESTFGGLAPLGPLTIESCAAHWAVRRSMYIQVMKYRDDTKKAKPKGFTTRKR